jgi:type VI secretion system protein ImpA
MPLRDDLLEPVAGDNPSGPDLYYNPIFEQIKEARREDSDDLPAGEWERSATKKADFRAVNKLAGDTLAQKSKDIRLANWYLESSIRLEGFSVLAPAIDTLRTLQQSFWETLHPMAEDGGDLEFRAMCAETATRQIADAVRRIPLTKNGWNYEVYQDSRIVGYEKDATSDAKKQSRDEAISQGRITAEDFDQAFAGTAKSLYADADAAMTAALAAVEELDSYQRDAYGTDFYPSLDKFRDSLESVHRIVTALLNEKRKTEPDPVQRVEGETAAEGGAVESGAAGGAFSFSGQLPGVAPVGELGTAYASVVASAQYFLENNRQSPVPYLICAGLRLGETMMHSQSPDSGFAVGPPPAVRAALRSLANRGAWGELLEAALPILASECARSWLDLHRYIWRAGQETGAEGLSAAVVGMVRSLLTIQPELRYWILEDDTGAANPETQRWLDSVVLG